MYISAYINIYKEKKNTIRLLKKKKNVAILATVPLGTVVIVQNLGGKKSGSRNHKTFIFSCGWS